jgi:nuclear transcription factor Y gamma
VISHLENDNHDYKIHQLPLARIKKVMKADPEVKMISAEAPILFAKGCDIFITELTMRAWIHAEDNKRRTLQRSDIAAALSKSDMFDFLIDIVPREEATSHAKRSSQAGATAPGPSAASGQMQTAPHGVQPHQHMGPADYGAMGQHGMPQEQEYRQQPAMYPGAVQSDPTAAYGQPQAQMFEGMYAYPHLPPQQVCKVSIRLNPKYKLTSHTVSMSSARVFFLIIHARSLANYGLYSCCFLILFLFSHARQERLLIPISNELFSEVIRRDSRFHTFFEVLDMALSSGISVLMLPVQFRRYFVVVKHCICNMAYS